MKDPGISGTTASKDHESAIAETLVKEAKSKGWTDDENNPCQVVFVEFRQPEEGDMEDYLEEEEEDRHVPTPPLNTEFNSVPKYMAVKMRLSLRLTGTISFWGF